MQRQALTAVAAALVFGSTSALAQSGELAGVTMRVLDDLRDVDAVVVALDAGRGEAEGDPPATGAPDDTARDAGADAGERTRDAAAGDEPAADAARRAERRERESLHDVDADERAEGRLEDRDVERSTAPPLPDPAP